MPCKQPFSSFVFLIEQRPPPSTLFPYTTLFRSAFGCSCRSHVSLFSTLARAKVENKLTDRKSTRLNSSDRCISYAVVCLKKKKYREVLALGGVDITDDVGMYCLKPIRQGIGVEL